MKYILYYIHILYEIEKVVRCSTADIVEDRRKNAIRGKGKPIGTQPQPQVGLTYSFQERGIVPRKSLFLVSISHIPELLQLQKQPQMGSSNEDREKGVSLF